MAFPVLGRKALPAWEAMNTKELGVVAVYVQGKKVLEIEKATFQ
jgi:hypothetical protein